MFKFAQAFLAWHGTTKSQSPNVNKDTVVTLRFQSPRRETTLSAALSGTGSAASLRSIDSLANQKPNVLIQVYSLVLFDSAASLLMLWGAGDGWWQIECLSALQRALDSAPHITYICCSVVCLKSYRKQWPGNHEFKISLSYTMSFWPV